MRLINRETSALRKMLEATRRELKEMKKLNHDSAMMIEAQKICIMELEQKVKKKDKIIRILQNKLNEKEKPKLRGV